MNYLVHLYLSDPRPLCRLGNAMGDFVKGPLKHHDLPEQVLFGVRQHRAVDTLALGHPAVRRSKMRLNDRFGHTKGILVDIFYDHFLARNWGRWAHGTLSAFAREAYRLFDVYKNLMPPAFREVAKRMAAHNWLGAYRDPDTIKLVLERMAPRLKRETALADGGGELARCGREMEADCLAFLRDAAAELKRNGNNG